MQDLRNFWLLHLSMVLSIKIFDYLTYQHNPLLFYSSMSFATRSAVSRRRFRSFTYLVSLSFLRWTRQSLLRPENRTYLHNLFGNNGLRVRIIRNVCVGSHQEL